MNEYEVYKCMSYRENIEDDLRAVTEATIDDLNQDLLDEFIKKYTEGKPHFQNIVEKKSC